MNRWLKLYEAGEKGDLQYLQECGMDFSTNTETLFRAVDNNHIECVRFLLPLSDLRVERGEILNGSSGLLLQTAVRNNNCEMVELLLPYCNPHVDNSLALQCASVVGNMELVNLLYPLSDPSLALSDIQERISIGVWPFSSADLLKARMQRDTLVSHMPPTERNTVRKL